LRLVDTINEMTEKLPESMQKSLLVHIKDMAWKEITRLVIDRVSTRFNTAELPFALPMDKYSVHTLDEVAIRGNDKGGFDIDSLRGEYCIEVYADDGSFAIDIYRNFKKAQTFNVYADGSYEVDLYEDGKMTRSADGKIENTTQYQELTPEIIDAVRNDAKKILDTDMFYVVNDVTDYLTEK